MNAPPLRHFLKMGDCTKEEIQYLFQRAGMIKDRFKRYECYHPLKDRTLALVFEKASTRTRVSFEAGMYQLGGNVVCLNARDSQMGRAEPIEDTARVISRMVDIAMPVRPHDDQLRVYSLGFSKNDGVHCSGDEPCKYMIVFPAQ